MTYTRSFPGKDVQDTLDTFEHTPRKIIDLDRIIV